NRPHLPRPTSVIPISGTAVFQGLRASSPSGDSPHPGRANPTLRGPVEPGPASDLLDLAVFQFDRGCPAEDRNGHLQARTHLVDLLDLAGERRKRAIRHADLLAHLEADRRL